MRVEMAEMVTAIDPGPGAPMADDELKSYYFAWGRDQVKFSLVP